MPYVRRNHLIGIRLPWTYESPIIWCKVNLLGDRLLLIFGLISIVVGTLGANWFIWSLICSTIILAVATTVYAYYLHGL
ncbi:SdpI family protein [Levilactobacillus cerevisiae]|uniref:SdpI family protein n=1 Tax=Levilactobacillus cerevisiae TaxID=1704076 RepID=UPI000F7B7A09